MVKSTATTHLLRFVPAIFLPFDKRLHVNSQGVRSTRRPSGGPMRLCLWPQLRQHTRKQKRTQTHPNIHVIYTRKHAQIRKHMQPNTRKQTQANTRKFADWHKKNTPKHKRTITRKRTRLGELSTYSTYHDDEVQRLYCF